MKKTHNGASKMVQQVRVLAVQSVATFGPMLLAFDFCGTEE